jgi:hypothetical protein
MRAAEDMETIVTGMPDQDAYRRPLFRQSVNWKIPLGSIKFCSHQDYEVTRFEQVRIFAARDLDYLPYCFDPSSQRMIFTILRPEDVAAALDSPFLYVGQRSKSTELLSVPFERLRELGDDADLSPVFIFSPGRTGSTLLSRMLSAVGCASVSEPDILTQVARMTPIESGLIGPQGATHVVKACVASLAKYHSRSPYIKLRSQCSAQAELIAGAMPGAKSAFLFRSVIEWGWSRHQQFGDKPDQLVNMLVVNIRAFDRLKEAGLAPVLLIYERLLSDPLRELHLVAPQIDLEDARLRNAIEAIRAKDSQEGTSLRRSRVNTKPPSKKFERALFQEWQRITPGGGG